MRLDECNRDLSTATDQEATLTVIKITDSRGGKAVIQGSNSRLQDAPVQGGPMKYLVIAVVLLTSAVYGQKAYSKKGRL
jgi:hypothetical protein